MRVGLFGGTFNPVHNGHIHIARKILYEYNLLDRLFFLPVYLPPHKRMEMDTAAEHRLQMLHLALDGEHRMQICSWEIERKEISYTIDTVRHWLRDDPNSDKYLVIGGDSAQNFTTWREWDDILQSVKVIVYDRSGFLDWRSQSGIDEARLMKFISISGDLQEISSTLVRELLLQRDWSGLRQLLPAAVISYIQQQGLYI